MQPSPQNNSRNTQHITVEFGNWIRDFTVMMSTRPRLESDKPMEFPISQQQKKSAANQFGTPVAIAFQQAKPLKQ